MQMSNILSIQLCINKEQKVCFKANYLFANMSRTRLNLIIAENKVLLHSIQALYRITIYAENIKNVYK